MALIENLTRINAKEQKSAIIYMQSSSFSHQILNSLNRLEEEYSSFGGLVNEREEGFLIPLLRFTGISGRDCYQCSNKITCYLMYDWRIIVKIEGCKLLLSTRSVTILCIMQLNPVSCNNNPNLKTTYTYKFRKQRKLKC